MTTPLLHDRMLASVMAAALAVTALSARAGQPAEGKEKCYGVAKAGENGCQSQSGSHTCGGCSSMDYRGEDWKWVPAGTCLSMGGQLQPFDGVGKRAAVSPVPKSQ